MKVIYPDFRDLFDGSSFTKAVSILQDKAYYFDRIMLGSSFCPFVFINSDIYLDAIAYCSESQKKISLVVPVFNEALLTKGKDKLNELIAIGKGVIDEVIINDIGMFHYVTERLSVSVILGRLFFKDPRDGRLPEYINRIAEISLLSYSDLINHKNVIGLEIDPIANTIDLSALRDYSGIVIVNGPYCFMSTGMICKYGSMHKPIDQKFRPSADCRFECQHMVEIHSDRRRPLSKKLIRAGKAIYFYQPEVKLIGRLADRYLFFPLDDYIQYLRGENSENIGST